MSTSEYCVGGLGAMLLAVILHRLGAAGYTLDLVREILSRTLDLPLIFGGLR